MKVKDFGESMCNETKRNVLRWVMQQLRKTLVMCRIFKVTGWLDPRGFDKRIHEIEVIETNKSFVGDGKRISKDKLMKIDTMFVENHKSMRYYTYCRDGEQQKALDMIKQHIIDKVKTYKSEIDALMQFVS